MRSQNKEDSKHVQDPAASVQVVHMGWRVCEERTSGSKFVDHTFISVKLECISCHHTTIQCVQCATFTITQGYFSTHSNAGTEVKTCKPSGPQGQHLPLLFLSQEVTRSIYIPTFTPSIKLTGSHLHKWVEKGTVGEVSHPRTQQNVPGQGSSPDCSIWSRAY